MCSSPPASRSRIWPGNSNDRISFRRSEQAQHAAVQPAAVIDLAVRTDGDLAELHDRPGISGVGRGFAANQPRFAAAVLRLVQLARERAVVGEQELLADAPIRSDKTTSSKIAGPKAAWKQLRMEHFLRGWIGDAIEGRVTRLAARRRLVP